jgi:hypothetical protein
VDSAFVLSNGMAATIKGRHFLPDPSDPKPGPGPQHYQPQLVHDSSHARSPTMLFSVASRVKNQRLYISPSFNVDLLGKDSPGPGTYRWGRSASQDTTRLACSAAQRDGKQVALRHEHAAACCTVHRAVDVLPGSSA